MVLYECKCCNYKTKLKTDFSRHLKTKKHARNSDPDFDILKETKEEIQYSEHIEPKKGFAICGMEYEDYIDVKKTNLNGLTYDEILIFLKNSKKEERLERYKKLLKFRNIEFDADLFTWNNNDI